MSTTQSSEVPGTSTDYKSLAEDVSAALNALQEAGYDVESHSEEEVMEEFQQYERPKRRGDPVGEVQIGQELEPDEDVRVGNRVRVEDGQPRVESTVVAMQDGQYGIAAGEGDQDEWYNVASEPTTIQVGKEGGFNAVFSYGGERNVDRVLLSGLGPSLHNEDQEGYLPSAEEFEVLSEAMESDRVEPNSHIDGYGVIVDVEGLSEEEMTEVVTQAQEALETFQGLEAHMEG